MYSRIILEKIFLHVVQVLQNFMKLDLKFLIVDKYQLQQKINDAERIGAQDVALRLTFERDRAELLGKYAAQSSKIAESSNKTNEQIALNKKRDAELNALNLTYQNSALNLDLQKKATSFDMLTSLQQEYFITQQTLAGKGEEARLHFRDRTEGP